MKEKRYWNEEMETLSPEKLRKLQEQGLQKTVERAYEKTRFYRNLFDQAGVKPEEIFQDLGINSEIELLPARSLERVTFKAQKIERPS
ncbi:MAG: hypothetical protein ABII26_00130 [Pseudomonadota bacterium]